MDVALSVEAASAAGEEGDVIEWINVNNRLPEACEEVRVLDNAGAECIAELTQRVDEGPWFFESEDGNRVNATRWQPLPESTE